MRYLFLALLFLQSAYAELSDQKLSVLYNSLDPRSVSQHLAFYELYGEHPLGKQSLKIAWELIAGKSYSADESFNEALFSNNVISVLIALVNKQSNAPPPLISADAYRSIQKLSQRLAHHQLRGHNATEESQVIALAPEEVDLARGLFLSQFGQDLEKVVAYESLIDLMALQIMARLPQNATAAEKISTINQFIFEEMGFKFPPHALYAKDVDLYTFLPSVLDSRRGVCLGVSILYLSIAQRLALPLEMVTPPGHIYVRYRNGKQVINIETTARGIHIDSENYLGINTRSLELRNMKEIIGLSHSNQAAAYWQKEQYQEALNSYYKAHPYLPGDQKIEEFMAYILLIMGKTEEAEALLHQVKDYLPDYVVSKGNMADDYLNGDVDAKGIQTVFLSVDENRESILAKKEKLEETLKIYPRFRGGLLQLAVAWLQLHRMGEALSILEQHDKLDTEDPEANYYMSVLYAQRHDYPNAWKHLRKTEEIVKRRNYYPKPLKELRRGLLYCCPESVD